MTPNIFLLQHQKKYAQMSQEIVAHQAALRELQQSAYDEDEEQARQEELAQQELKQAVVYNAQAALREQQSSVPTGTGSASSGEPPQHGSASPIGQAQPA